MSKLSSAFKFNDSIRTKSFEIKGNKFTVRVPLASEKAEIDKSTFDISEDEVNVRYKEMTDVIRESLLSQPVDGIEITENDVIINGSSSRDNVKSLLRMERKIVKYFHLLVPDDGSTVDFTYKDIDEELPLQLQLEIVEKISEAIEPNYREARKN